MEVTASLPSFLYWNFEIQRPWMFKASIFPRMRILGFAGSQRSQKCLISTGAFAYDSKESIECIRIRTEEEEKLAFFHQVIEWLRRSVSVFPVLDFAKSLTDNDDWWDYLTSTDMQSWHHLKSVNKDYQELFHHNRGSSKFLSQIFINLTRHQLFHEK